MIQKNVKGSSYSITTVEEAVAIANELESKNAVTILDIEPFYSTMKIERLLFLLIDSGAVDEGFKTFISKEYGEPWIKGFPIDKELFTEAFEVYYSLSKKDAKETLKYILAHICLRNESLRESLKDYYISRNHSIVEIKPIPEKFRILSNIVNKDVSTKETSRSKTISTESIEAINEYCSAIEALTDNDLIVTQTSNIRELIN